MKEIHLTKGRASFVDDEGVYWQNIYQKWCAQIRVNGKRKTIGRFEAEVEAAHAYDMAALEFFGDFARLNFPIENKTSCVIEFVEPPKLTVDYGSRRQVNNTSGYRGVSWQKKNSKWRARLKRVHIGSFDNAIDAACAYDQAAIKAFGQLAKLNFYTGLI